MTGFEAGENSVTCPGISKAGRRVADMNYRSTSWFIHTIGKGGVIKI